METDWRMVAKAALNEIVECLEIVLEERAVDESERDEFLHLAKRSLLYLLEKRKLLPDIELLIRDESRFPSKETKKFVQVLGELCAGIETLTELMSVALEAIASSPEQEHLLQETCDLASSLLEKNRELLVMALPYVQDDRGHFSMLRTRITNLQILKLTLEDLGLNVEMDTYTRGGGGERIKADIVAVLKGNYDIGWSRNGDGSVDMIADLWGLAKTCNHTELINSINQGYAQNVSKE